MNRHVIVCLKVYLLKSVGLFPLFLLHPPSQNACIYFTDLGKYDKYLCKEHYPAKKKKKKQCVRFVPMEEILYSVFDVKQCHWYVPHQWNSRASCIYPPDIPVHQECARIPVPQLENWLAEVRFPVKLPQVCVSRAILSALRWPQLWVGVIWPSYLHTNLSQVELKFRIS